MALVVAGILLILSSVSLRLLGAPVGSSPSACSQPNDALTLAGAIVLATGCVSLLLSIRGRAERVRRS